MAREFTSRPGKGQQSPAGFEFRLDGVRFRVELRDDADSVLEWSELAQAAADSEAEIQSAEGAAFVARFFKLMMPPDQYRAFRDHMRRKRTSQDVLIEIMQAINEEMEKQVGQAADRPTRRPLPSSGGRGAKDDRTLKIISLPEGDVEFSDRPPQSRQQRRAQQRRQQRRRAG